MIAYKIRKPNCAKSGVRVQAFYNPFFNSTTSSATALKADTFEAVSSFYSIVSQNSPEFEGSINASCVALSLAAVIIDAIEKENFTTRGSSLKNDFYQHCLARVLDKGSMPGMDDDELIIIHLKQMVNILRSAGIISTAASTPRVTADVARQGKLYRELLMSFWNTVKWENIFPSNEEAARALQENRGIMKDLLVNSYDNAGIDDISNEFFELTGFAPQGDLLMVSFLDFYFFTWLKNFGILQYRETRGDKIRIQVTDEGRKILKLL